MKRREYIHFKPTGQNFENKKDFDEAHAQFYQGELSEEFMNYCAEKALHAFWINYKDRPAKVDKQVFCQKFKELVNQMLKDL